MTQHVGSPPPQQLPEVALETVRHLQTRLKLIEQ